VAVKVNSRSKVGLESNNLTFEWAQAKGQGPVPNEGPVPNQSSEPRSISKPRQSSALKKLISVSTLAVTLIATFAAVEQASAQQAVPGEFLIKMKGRPSSARSAGVIGKVGSKAALKATFGKLNMHHMAAKPGQDLSALIAELRADPDVEYVEPNYLMHKIKEGEASEKMAKAEAVESLAEVNRGLGGYVQSGAPTKTTQAWAQANLSSSEIPIVAVIDTGVDYEHAAFANSGAIWINAGEIAGNGIDDDGNGYIDDVRGWNFVHNSNDPMDDDDHGSHVAGIILGVTKDIYDDENSPAMMRIMPLKFLSADGSGSTSDAVQAIYYAVNNGARVINNSWGGETYSQALHDALTFAYNNHVALTAAAGNFSSNNDVKALFPANYPIPSQLTVAASNDFDQMASFSNYGAVTVQVAAPGVGILSTVPGHYYRYMSGTSMAAPFVAGLMVMALREAPQLTGFQVRNLVMNSGEYVTSHKNKTITGFRVNSLNTVVNSKTQVSTDPDQPNYVASAQNVPQGSRAPAAEAQAAKVGGCGMVGSAYLYESYKNPGGSGPTGAQAVAVLTLLPLLIWQVLRMRAHANNPANRRVHDRFVMNSEIKVRMGERELVGNLSTISMGGVSFQAEAMLEKGGVVTLQIAGPDGGEQIQVEGRIVWNESNHAYGVQFQDAKSGVLDRISNWTSKLAKAS